MYHYNLLQQYAARSCSQACRGQWLIAQTTFQQWLINQLAKLLKPIVLKIIQDENNANSKQWEELRVIFFGKANQEQ